MSRLDTFLPAIAFALFPVYAGAASFSGLSVGIGASSHALDLESQFDDHASANASVREYGPMLDLGYGARLSRNVHVQAGVRKYSVELEANLYSDDCVKVDNHAAAYAQVGYVIGVANVIYGVLESGGADVLVATRDYPHETFEVDTFAFGIGYKRAFSEHVEFFVEGTNRSYDNIAIHYDDGRYAGDKKDIQLDSTNVIAGFTFRF